MNDMDLIEELALRLKPYVQEALAQAMRGELVPEINDICLIDEAADFTRIAKFTIYQQTSKNWKKLNPGRVGIPHSKRGNKLYFSKKELRAWMMNGNGGE